jgi:hypothetical protein
MSSLSLCPAYLQAIGQFKLISQAIGHVQLIS